VVECLSSNWEALSPNPKTAKQSKAKQTSQIKKKTKKQKRTGSLSIEMVFSLPN
jgi:hypothetical protein